MKRPTFIRMLTLTLAFMMIASACISVSKPAVPAEPAVPALPAAPEEPAVPALPAAPEEPSTGFQIPEIAAFKIFFWEKSLIFLS